jgi:hypothetical protein
VTRITPSDLLRWINQSRLAALGNDRSEVRALAFMVEVVFFALVSEPGLFIGFIDESLQWKVASMSAFGRWPMAIAFIAAALMVLPHMFTLAFLPEKLSCQWPRKVAAFGCIVAAASWGMLAYISNPLDYEWLTGLFLSKCLVSLWLGVIVGLSLNAQQAREKAASLIRWQRMKDALVTSQRTFNDF